MFDRPAHLINKMCLVKIVRTKFIIYLKTKKYKSVVKGWL